LFVMAALTAGGMALFGADEAPPFHLPTGVEMIPDLMYTTGPREMRLDLYLPKNRAKPAPAVVYIHGGGWSAGVKTDFRRQAAALAARGIAGVCIEYSLVPAATWPEPLYEAKAAVRWMRAQALKYGFDVNRMAAAGGSAGGQLAALLGTTADDPKYEGNLGNPKQSTRVKAVVAFNPVLDMPALARNDSTSKIVIRYLGATYAEKPDVWAEASPIDHVSNRAADFLFLHGDADTTVPIAQSEAMAAKLQKLGIHAEIFTAPGAKHAFFNRPPWFEPTLTRMEEFLEKELLQ
jgi:pectinesterase